MVEIHEGRAYNHVLAARRLEHDQFTFYTVFVKFK